MAERTNERVADRAARSPRRRWLAPEVVQTSPMDCGPASLKSILEGFGIDVAYGRLREACQTHVDGTSIDEMAEVARKLGFDAGLVLVPVDHVAHPSAATLPAIAVVRLPSGDNHFVVLWRRSGPFVQVMDPATGRRWMRAESLRDELYVHGVDMPAATWRRFAAGPHALAILESWLARLGHARAKPLVAGACADATWRSLAALEAAARMVRSLVARGAVEHGPEAAALFDSLYEHARSDDPATQLAVPAAYWSVRPHAALTEDERVLLVRGALLVRVRGSRTDAAIDPRTLSRELAAALTEPRPRPLLTLLREIAPRDRRTAIALVALALASGAGLLAQALVFQALLVLGARFSVGEQRLGLAAALVVFSAALFLLELPLVDGLLRLGRAVEARWRTAFQTRIPRLPASWFSSRPSSDMAERAHGLSLLRGLPALVVRAVRSVASLVLTAAGLCWLDPDSAWLVLLALACACAAPLAFQPALQERELSLRNHQGALARFYLETLLGLVAVRAHGAERRIRREHESLLVEWLRAGRRVARTATVARAATSTIAFATAAWLVVDHLSRRAADPGALLFVYWSLSLPALGEQLAQAALQLPSMRNATLRVLEPITAPTESEDPRARADDAEAAVDAREEPLRSRPVLKAAGASALVPHRRDEPPALRALPRDRGAVLELARVELVLAGHPVLERIDLSIAAGEHVALVGRSGAGKSSLVSVLLGLHRPTAGRASVDGRALDELATADLRRATAWVDPAAQLWNQSLFDNLAYGSGAVSTDELARALDDAALRGLLEELPAGLSTPLGENGGFVSGGEGQRVRLARALLRRGVRLALLDEPFRGLDRDTRRALLARARERWRDATLLCATHDLDETLAFDRVVVLDRGRIVADGEPRALAADAHGAYADLLRAEREMREAWASPMWTRWRVEAGRLRVEPGPERAT